MLSTGLILKERNRKYNGSSNQLLMDYFIRMIDLTEPAGEHWLINEPFHQAGLILPPFIFLFKN